MPSLWEVLKTSKGLPAPDGFTALFAHSLSDTYTLAEISGIPPLNLGEIVEIVDYTIEGNIYQSDGVSHDTPQEVVGCGDRTGNLITNETTTAGYYLDSSGILNNVSHEYLKYLQPVEVKPNTTYTLSTNTTIYTYWTSDVSDTINEGIKRVYVNDSKVTITTGENERYLRISISERNAGFEWLMLNKGTEPLPYEPYGYRIPVETRGKNLFDISTVVLGKYINSNGEEVASTGISNHSDFIPVVGDKEFTLSSYKPSYNDITYAIAWYTSDKEFIYRDSEVALSNEGRFLMTRISPTNARYAIINFSDYPNFQKENVQLELGTEATSYEPYTPPITTPIYLDSPLYKIGDYADSIGSKEEVRVIKELILTGKENWRLVSTGRFVLSSITDYLRENDKLICYTTHYLTDKNTSNVAAVADKRAFFYFSSGDTWTDFYIKDSSFSTPNDFRAYLAAQYAAGTPVKVWYVLQTPESKAVDAVKIPTIQGTNIIDINTEVKPSNLKITYKSKI